MGVHRPSSHREEEMRFWGAGGGRLLWLFRVTERPQERRQDCVVSFATQRCKENVAEALFFVGRKLEKQTLAFSDALPWHLLLLGTPIKPQPQLLQGWGGCS